jgi:heat shock protein HslJ
VRRAAVLAALTVVSLAALVLALGPTSGGGDDAVALTSLEEAEGTWEADDASAAPAGLVAPVRVVVEKGGLFVETGCNTGRGPAHVEDGRLVVDALATTRRACVPPLDAQERWVLEMLQSGPLVTREGAALVLTWGETEIHRLGFRRLDPGAGG